MNIEGKYVLLRALETEDLEVVRESVNDPEVEGLVVGWSFPLSREDQLGWYQSTSHSEKTRRFAIETRDDGLVGLSVLSDIDWKNRSASHGIKLFGRQRRSRGIGTDALMAVMRYAFDELQMHRLDACWFSDNAASRSLHLKCGWTEEGTRRSCVYKGGSYRDITTAGILVEEYRLFVERTGYWG